MLYLRVIYSKLNFLLFCMLSVPPQDVTIVNMNKMTLQSATLTPVMEGQPLQLICIAHGGKVQTL